MADEINDEKDEVSDLASDIKAVISHLESILDKLSSGEAEETEDEEVEEEFGSEEEPFEEAVDLKPVPSSAGAGLIGPKGKFEVKGAVKVSKGKADSGQLEIAPDLKELPKGEDLTKVKGANTPNRSTIKVGDFFK